MLFLGAQSEEGPAVDDLLCFLPPNQCHVVQVDDIVIGSLQEEDGAGLEDTGD